MEDALASGRARARRSLISRRLAAQLSERAVSVRDGELVWECRLRVEYVITSENSHFELACLKQPGRRFLVR